MGYHFDGWFRGISIFFLFFYFFLGYYDKFRIFKFILEVLRSLFRKLMEIVNTNTMTRGRMDRLEI